jgi:diaminohydroxyphosphoribosylaminopyrimidine deaminase/5-amino-6-(5-phosphoribosylamino)uracil reductase
VLADRPLLTVRHVADHAGKKRALAVLSASGRRAPADWVARQTELGFEVLEYGSLEAALSDLGARGVHQVLVEAGPKLGGAIEATGAWDEKLVFIADPARGMEREVRCSRES